MKKIIIISAALIVLITGTTFAQDKLKKNLAEVEQYHGYYVFVDAKPVAEYEFLGSEKVSTTLSLRENFTDVKERMVKKVAKEYPKADAIIFHFDNNTCDAVKFK